MLTAKDSKAITRVMLTTWWCLYALMCCMQAHHDPNRTHSHQKLDEHEQRESCIHTYIVTDDSAIPSPLGQYALAWVVSSIDVHIRYAAQ